MALSNLLSLDREQIPKQDVTVWHALEIGAMIHQTQPVHERIMHK